ncbi:MAG: hypothetical protein Q4C47_02195 [Planctomycetia bacterium]|nr:hypothetical protein [Planctomycetia bacterium]
MENRWGQSRGMKDEWSVLRIWRRLRRQSRRTTDLFRDREP